MFNEKDYLKLHRGIAVLHKKLRHTDDAHIAWVGSDSEEDAKIPSGKESEFTMRMLPLTGQINGGDDDYAVDSIYGGFEIVATVKSGTAVKFREIEEKRSEAMLIGKQIIARLHAMSQGQLCEDGDDAHLCRCAIPGFELSSVRYSSLKLENNVYGYVFTYKLADAEGLDYDATAFDEAE